jgi:hypothetical protein
MMLNSPRSITPPGVDQIDSYGVRNYTLGKEILSPIPPVLPLFKTIFTQELCWTVAAQP